MDTKDVEKISFQIISNVGAAKTLIMEALYAARESNYDIAKNKLQESKKYFITAHKVHAKLIQQEAAGGKIDINMIFLHAEDQLMNVETVAELVKEMIEMYKKINGQQIARIN